MRGKHTPSPRKMWRIMQSAERMFSDGQNREAERRKRAAALRREARNHETNHPRHNPPANEQTLSECSEPFTAGLKQGLSKDLREEPRTRNNAAIRAHAQGQEAIISVYPRE